MIGDKMKTIYASKLFKSSFAKGVKDCKEGKESKYELRVPWSIISNTEECGYVNGYKETKRAIELGIV
jgi:hypothetical protein